MKRIEENESGITYTLEAIIGVSLIIGTIIYMTGNMPYTAQKTGDYSKVQLINIGRDTLDLIVITPIYEVCPGCFDGIVDRKYYLKADKTFVTPGENVTFNVTYLNGTTVIEKLQLYQTISGYFVNTFMKNITGTTYYSWNVSSNQNEYSIMASGPAGISNSVTIKVGYYFLDTDTFGIFLGANDTNVSGVVYNSSGGIPNLTMQIFKEDLTPVNLSAGKTNYGKIIENFDNYNNWSSNGNLTNNTSYKTEGTASMSVNSTSGEFLINKTLTQVVDEFDILSFDFYSNTGNEKITVVLKNGTYKMITLTDANIVQKGWGKINTRITNTTVIDKIEISVSNITNETYMFDNMTIGDGKFKFQWPLTLPTGVYFINATDGFQSSNKRYIEVSDHYSSGNLLCKDMYIKELDLASLFLTDNDCDSSIRAVFGPIRNQYYVNEEKCGDEFCSTTGTPNPKQNNYRLFSLDPTTLGFTASVAGDYYIYRHSQGRSAGTNTIIIHVLPFEFGRDVGDTCIDKNELKEYLNNYMPPYVDYNLYLIDSHGNRFKKCTKFDEGELINGYPTDEAVTVNKLVHIKYKDIDDILEYRMVLWYK